MTNLDFKNNKNDPALSLRDDERALMRARLLEHARQSPVVAPSPFMFLVRVRFAALALVLVISTTSVSFAAEGALPGETLYGLKVSVNERVEYLLAPGTEAKGGVALRQAEERIREVEVLAVQGKLDAVQAEEALLLAKEHIDTAIANADVLAEAGNESAARGIEARLSATLLAHMELLEAQAVSLEGDSADRVRTLAVALSEASLGQGGDSTMEAADDQEMYTRATYTRTKSRLDELKRGINDVGVPVETVAELSAEHERLSTEFALGEELMYADDAENAGAAYGALEKRAVRALTFLKAARDIARETDKEVVLALNAPAEIAAPVANARAAKEAPGLMMATTLSLEAAMSVMDMATSSQAEEMEIVQEAEVPEETSAPLEPRLRLWLRDRITD